MRLTGRSFLLAGGILWSSLSSMAVFSEEFPDEQKYLHWITMLDSDSSHRRQYAWENLSQLVHSETEMPQKIRFLSLVCRELRKSDLSFELQERLFFLEDEGLVVCSGRRYAGDVLDQNAYEISISGKGRVFYFNVWDNDPDIAERLAEDIREKALAQTEPGIREMLMRAFEGLSGRMRNAPGEFPEKGKQEQEIDGRGFGQGQMASGEKSDNLKALSHEFFNDYELGF